MLHKNKPMNLQRNDVLYYEQRNPIDLKNIFQSFPIFIQKSLLILTYLKIV